MAGGSASGRHRRRPAVDRISDLTDELLQDILLRLRSPHAAARTSVLSRRWSRVWVGLPNPAKYLYVGHAWIFMVTHGGCCLL
ncbi:hypothetical protein EJB05_11883, partial [Eragrostis curvula]